MNDDAILTNIRQQQASYRPSQQTLDQIAGKTLVMFIGPTGIGKTSLIHEVQRLRPDYERVSIVTTRPRKPEDPPTFQTSTEGITPRDIQRWITTGELVEYSVNTNGYIYGQLPSGFPGNVNLMALLPSGVEPLRNAGFGKIVAVYIVTQAETWRQWLKESRSSYVDLSARLDEAINSIDYAFDHRDKLAFVANRAGELESTAASIVRIIEGSSDTLNASSAESFLTEMKQVAKEAKASL